MERLLYWRPRRILKGWLWKRACIPGTVKDEWRRALEMEHLSLWELLYWGPPRICQERHWKWASFSIGEHGDAPFLGPSREGWNFFLFFIRRTFIEEFEIHVKEGSENGQLSPKAPLLGNLEGVHLLGLLRDRWRRALEMEHLLLFYVVLRMKPQSTFCVSVRLWFHLDMHIWVPSFWTWGYYESKLRGHLELQ